MKSGTDEVHKLTETVYKNLVENFSYGVRQILLTGKAYYKALQVVTSAAQAYNEALGQFGAEARLCRGGTEEIGEAIHQIAEAQRAIQARLKDSAKALFSELILPLEQKMEKDFKKASSDVRKYSQGHKLVMSPFNKAYDTLKKFRKKTKNKPVYDSEKEANHMRSLGKCQEKLDEFRIQGLRSALLEERRCHCFVLQRLCSVAHLDYGVHRQGVDVYVSLRDWEDVCSNPHQLPPSADRVIADFMDDYQPMNGGTEYHGNGHGYLHRDTQSLQNGLRRSKSSQELNWNRGRLDGTQTLPHSMSPPPAPQGHVQATYNFTATQENQMSFTDGDIIVLMGEKSEGWQYGHNMNTHRMGWFPLSFTKPLTSGRSSPDFKALSPSNRTQSVGDMLDVHPPPPPDHLQYDPGLPGNMRRPNSLYDGPPQTNSSPQRQPSTRVNAVNTPVRQLSNNPPPPPLQDHATIEENVNHQNNPMFASVSLRKAQTNDRSAPKF